MVVFVTHNGGERISKIKLALQVFGTDGEDVLFIDNQTTDPQSILNLRDIESSNFPFSVKVDKTCYETGYEPGAFIWAFRNHKASHYLFLQDSMEIVGPDWVRQFKDKMMESNADVVPFGTFRPLMFGMTPENILFLIQSYGAEIWHRHYLTLDGIFGNMFYATREILEKADELGMFPDTCIPTSKVGAQAMERGFAIALAEAGATVAPLYGMAPGQKEGWPLHDLCGGLHLRKTFGGRG